MQRNDLPRFFISDRDGIFGNWFKEFLDDCYGMRLYRTPPRRPNCNAHAERVVRTSREELLDRCIIYNESDLRRVLAEFVDDYNLERNHMSLDDDTPLTKFEWPIGRTVPKYVKKRILGGLITDFAAAA